MIINQIAHTVFNSFADTDIVVAILNHNGSYISNKLDVFEKVFFSRTLLEELCGRVDDGQEPLIAVMNGYLVVAGSLSADFRNIGYAVMLLPIESFASNPKSLDFIEIILEQFSMIAGLIEQNQQLKNVDSVSIGMESPVLACTS